MKNFKTLLTGLICIMAFLLVGCIRGEQTFVVDENNNVTFSVKYSFNKEKTDQYIADAPQEDAEFVQAMIQECEVQNLEGTEYYVMEESSKMTEDDLKENYPNYVINKDKFYIYSADSEEEPDNTLTEDFDTLEDLGITAESLEYVGICAQLPSEIVKTNGTLQEDKTTVEWDMTSLVTDTSITEMELYAYTANDPGDPVADRKTVEKQIADYYDDDDPFGDHDFIYYDNTPTPVPTSTQKPQNNVNNDTQNQTSKAPQPTTEPKKDTVKTPKKDTKAPVIKGIKKNKSYKNKVTVYVKDNKKLKKVTINGKKVKLKKVKKGKYKGYYKFTIKKKGKKTIVAYDAAGNKKKIPIKIK